MSVEPQRPRLDEILIREGMISQEQINEALTHQKTGGGKLGSQLLHHHFIEEADLVRALALQFGCEGVVLRGITIASGVIDMIPRKIALARRVLPFNFDADSGILMIACEDPNATGLLDELAYVAENAQPKLYVAAELSLVNEISHYYEGHCKSTDDSMRIEKAEIVLDSMPLDLGENELLNDPSAPVTAGTRGEILLVTDDEDSGPMLSSLFEHDNYAVTTTNSADDAIELIQGRSFDAAFIKDTVPGDYIDLIDRLRKTSPRTKVRYYESSASLLLDQDTITDEGNLLTGSLEIFTSLLSLMERLPGNHSGCVGQHCDRLCHKLGLPDKIRFQITTAGYLHDLARYYYHLDANLDQRSTIKLTAKLLQGINFSPVITAMLRSMYMDLKGKYTKRLPVEVLGGNILTIADLYCESVDANEKLALDRFEKVRSKFQEVTGKLLLKEVVDAFCEMIEEQMLSSQDDDAPTQVMIYADNPGAVFPIQKRLKSDGYQPLVAGDSSEIVQLWQRRQPDFLVLALHGTAMAARVTVESLIESGIDPKTTPCFVLGSGCTSAELTGLLELGIRDVMEFDLNLDLLANGLNKAREELLETSRSQAIKAAEREGTKGLLSDMSLIDLLQALGPSRRTAKLTVQSANPEIPQLTVYLHQGAISFAKLDQLLGAQALYEALTWKEGVWTVRPVDPSELPKPNNDQPNESILMEGCRLLDEKSRKQQAQKPTGEPHA
jgi:DNA-binding response OmpR family regulator